MVNQNCEDVKVTAEKFASRSFTRGTDSWILAFGSELIRLTAQKCIELDDNTGYTVWPEELTCVGTKIEEHFGI